MLGNLNGKKIALLGLAFKPNTDDMRESPAIAISGSLLAEGAEVVAYDPIATPNAKFFMPGGVEYVNSAEEAINGADTAFIVTDWEEFKNLELSVFAEKLQEPVVFDGRNCYDLKQVKDANIDYYSIGRPAVTREEAKELSKTN